MKTLIHCCAQLGIEDWVYSEGPEQEILIQALQSCKALQCYCLPDDLNPAAFALGRARRSLRPTAIILSQAEEQLPHCLPALQAAQEEARPLLLISNGHLEQSPLAQYAHSIQINTLCTIKDLQPLQDLLKAKSIVHLQVEGQYALSGSVEEIALAEPPPAAAFRGSLVALSQMLRFKADEGLILMLGALDEDEQAPALWLAETLRVPVIADAASGLREELKNILLHDAAAILSHIPPRFILRLGEVPTDPFWAQLEDLKQTEVFSLTRSGNAGLERKSYVSTGELEQIMKAIGNITPLAADPEVKRLSRQKAALQEELMLRYPESKAALIHALSLQSCMCETISLVGDTAIRLWGDYAQLHIPTTALHASRQDILPHLSAYLGYSADDETQSSLLFCDENALKLDFLQKDSLAALPPSRRIIALLPNADSSAPLKELASCWQAHCIAIDSEADFDALEELGEKELAFLLIYPDQEQTQAFEKAFHKA